MEILHTAKGRASIRLTEQEAVILLNVINEAREAVEDWEFQTRIGAEPAEVDVLRKELKTLLSAVRGQ